MDMKRTASGFTLPELLVTVALAAVLAGVAAPNLAMFIKRSSVETQAQRLIGSIHLARSEAARLNMAVTICRSTTGNSCSNTSTWDQGWLIFADDNADGAIDADDDKVLRFIDSADTNFSITPTNNYTNRITFRATGDATTSGRLVICPASGEEAYGREVILNAVGRPRLHKGLTSDCSAS
ncbi:MAG: GspH/FimT family pseudopilin [Cellvibrionaceae bacterium]